MEAVLHVLLGHVDLLRLRVREELIREELVLRRGVPEHVEPYLGRVPIPLETSQSSAIVCMKYSIFKRC